MPRSPVRFPTRRDLLRYALTGAGAALLAPLLNGCSRSAAHTRQATGGLLGEPDANGVRLPPGFSARIVARSGERPAAGSSYVWHPSPDGGAVFGTGDGGWVYVSNSEMVGGKGGVGALHFDRDAAVVDAYSICSGTSRNCAGGATPWGTWLSCEEIPTGRVWECDPHGRAAAQVRPALGTFMHEAIAVDPTHGSLYLTEDTADGRWYRFRPEGRTPHGHAALTHGVLEVAQVLGGEEGKVVWHPVPDPRAAQVRTAQQVAVSTPFNGGEGIYYHAGVVYFATKGDDRVWAYDTASETLRIIYDDDTSPTPELTGVDNVTVSPAGDVLVAEDGGDMQIVALTHDGGAVPILQVVGHHDSEIAGPAFDPSGTRLYFSSQRGPNGGINEGITFEVRGPFGGSEKD